MNITGSEENEYVMKAVMRSFGTLQETVVPFLADLLPKLTEKLAIVSKNPSRPNFNHYLFETLSVSIKIVCKTNPEAVTSFEQALFPIFQEILQQDIPGKLFALKIARTKSLHMFVFVFRVYSLCIPNFGVAPGAADQSERTGIVHGFVPVPVVARAVRTPRQYSSFKPIVASVYQSRFASDYSAG